MHFSQRRLGALGRCHRVASGLALLVLIAEQQRAPGFEHVPLDVVGEHAQEDVCTHARLEAMADGGTLRVSARATPLPDEGVEGAPAGPWVRVSFRDTGPGIPEEDRARIFTPFWTTKRDGSGLGLALAHKSVTDHGGRLHLYSRVSVGTEFVILLPGVSS